MPIKQIRRRLGVCALLTSIAFGIATAALAATDSSTPQKKKYYAIMTLEIFPGKHQEFIKLLQANIPVLEKGGIRLVNSYTITIGALYKVVDVWECDDAGTMYSTFMNSGSWDEAGYSTVIKSEIAEFAETSLPPLPSR